MNTAWELTVTPYLREKPNSWTSEAYSKFREVFGGCDEVRGILIFLAEGGAISFGQRGLSLNDADTWSFEDMRIELN